MPPCRSSQAADHGRTARIAESKWIRLDQATLFASEEICALRHRDDQVISQQLGDAACLPDCLILARLGGKRLTWLPN